MSDKAWLILWGALLLGSLLLWAGLLRRTYRSFRRLQSELRRIGDAVSSAKGAWQTTLNQNPQSSNGEDF